MNENELVTNVESMTDLNMLKRIQAAVAAQMLRTANASFMVGDYAVADLGRTKGNHPVYITKIGSGRNAFNVVVVTENFPSHGRRWKINHSVMSPLPAEKNEKVKALKAKLEKDEPYLFANMPQRRFFED